MDRIVKYIFATIICLFLSVLPVMAEQITYDNTLKYAVDNSFDLKMSAIDIDISKTNLKASRSDLFPIFSSQINTEYNKDLANDSSAAYVGNTVMSPYTQYKDLAYLSVSYNLFDFGTTGKKILIAKKDVAQKKIAYDLQLKDLRLKILDLYTKTLLYNNEIISKSRILQIYQELFLSREKLFESGTANKLLVMDEAVKIARAQDDIESSKLELKKVLHDLSSYTKQEYTLDKLDVTDFDNTNIVPVSNFTPKLIGNISENIEFKTDKTLEARYYDFEIEKKKAELSIYKRQRLPIFKFYSNYSFYGQNADEYTSALDNMAKRSFAIGVSATYTFFDGFKNKASREKATYEIKKLQLEKEKKLSDLKNEYEKSYSSYLSYTEELKIKKDLLNQVKGKLNALDRMNKNGLAQKTDILTAKADLLSQELDLQKNVINISSKIKEIKIMAEGQSRL